jgi:hypothetical protein
MNLREAAQQALEALWTAATPKAENAITALRTALAKPERDWSLLEATQESLREHMAEIKQLRDKLQRTETEQEPVAWIEHGLIEAPDGLVWERGTVGHYTPLYTRPAPQRKPLTDEEIANVLGFTKFTAYSTKVALTGLARSIERAHGIGGEA